MIIAHLSDLHINNKYFPERSELLHQMLHDCHRGRVDHVIITGDISHLGKEEELEQSAVILREHGYWESSRLTVTIGNHDIFGGPFFAEDVLTFPSLCRKTNFEAKVQIFNEIFGPSFASSIHGTGADFFPFVKFVGDIAFIGLNTVAPWSAMRNPLGSNGQLDDAQYDRLNRLFNDSRLHGRRLFVLSHHHFHSPQYRTVNSVIENVWQRIEGQTLKLHGRKRLLELFQAHGVEKILHGHVHEHTEYRQGGVTCLNAGASMLPAGNDSRNFHIIQTKTDVILKKSAERRRPDLYRAPHPQTNTSRYVFST